MSKLMVAALAVASMAASCAPADPSQDVGSGPDSDAGRSGLIGSDGGGPGATVAVEIVGDDGDFNLGFATDEPPAVVVASVLGPTITAVTSPGSAVPVVAELPNPTLVGGPLAFQLVDPAADLEAEWLEVYLPVRPNGTTGWIRTEEVALSRNPYRIEIDTSDHRLAVFRENKPWLSTEVAIGTGETPTPIGRFYIIELLQPPTPDGPYGPFAFGLSGFSETLTSFAGGDGVIGIHGTNDPAALGTDVSHGCVRLSNDTIESLAGVIPLGTPVVITV